MSKMVRHLYAAALVAGFGLPAVIARAADYQTYWPDNSTSRVQLISATEDVPQRADDSSVRPADPRGAATADADYRASNSATYPPPKKPAKKPAAKPAIRKDLATAPDPADAETAAGKPAPATVRRAPATAQTQLRAAPATRYDSQLTAHYAVEEEAAPTMRRPAAVAPPPAIPPDAATESVAAEGCSDCGCDCCDCPVWCGGVEYLFLRPHFGNDLAFHQQTITTTNGVGNANGAVITQDRAVNFDYDYNSDYRIVVGRHVGNGELRFAYTHIQGEDNVSGSADGGFLSGSGVAVQGLGGTQLTGAGDTVNATSHLLLSLYDIDDVQHIDMPGCGECGNGWDLSWSFGVRFATIHRTIDEQDPFEVVNLGSSFNGVGPRIGMEGRRNLWGTHFAAYVNADASLLVGHYRSAFQEFVPGVLEDTVTEQANNETRVVPNFELSLGVSWQPTCHTTLTTGWMVETFTDGIGSTANTGGCTSCNMVNPLAGSGNILSFDGLFIRMEHCF